MLGASAGGGIVVNGGLARSVFTFFAIVLSSAISSDIFCFVQSESSMYFLAAVSDFQLPAIFNSCKDALLLHITVALVRRKVWAV